MENKVSDPSSKKFMMYSPHRKYETSIEDTIEPLELNEVTRSETMGLCLSLAQVQERYILFEEEPRVLILYASGSFGCLRIPSGDYVASVGSLEKVIRSYCILCDNEYKGDKDWIYTPLSVFKKRIRYKVKELSRIMPSSNMNLGIIAEIANEIKKEYYNYEAFIILHGTDTIGCTAPILSFMLENLKKTVIITSCLIPLSETRNDASNNLITALTIAGHYWIPEVCVLFGDGLYRGNRIIKDGTSALDLIKSPNFPPLANIESYFNIAWDSILYSNTKKPFNAFTSLESNLTSVSLFPFMSLETLNSVFVEGVKGNIYITLGVIIGTYGLGNFPSNRPDLLEVIKKAINDGVIVINVTQCIKGDVSDIYEGAVILSKIGVINGLDMTLKCALAKLSYLLGKGYPTEKIKKMMIKNLRGEITNPKEELLFTVHTHEFLVNSSEIVREFFPNTVKRNNLVPTLLNEAAALVLVVNEFIGKKRYDRETA